MSENELLMSRKGVVKSVLLLWIVRPGDGGAWSWARRYPPVVEGMSEALIKEFFRGMDEQHHKVMGSKEHICKSSHRPIPYRLTALHRGHTH